MGEARQPALRGTRARASRVNVDDSYRELGLAPGCSDAEVKAAWRRLAARWHPDRNSSPLALRKIQRINHALEEIRRFRASSFGPMTEDGFPFEQPPQAPAAEAPRQQPIRLTLEEALAGCIKDIEGELAQDCASCAGTGMQQVAATCRRCGGSGRARPQRWLAWRAPEAECRACRGSGKVRQPCPACAGSGRTPVRRYRCRARIPAGLRPGDLLHVSASLEGRPAGGKVLLALRVELAPHEFFTLDEDGTVRCELPVDGFAWVANRWVEVPTPAGLQQMRLRRGYHTYRIKGQGFPAGEAGARADCIVTVVPLFPQEFSRSQEAGIDRLVASNTGAAGSGAGRRAAAWQRALHACRRGSRGADRIPGLSGRQARLAPARDSLGRGHSREWQLQQPARVAFVVGLARAGVSSTGPDVDVQRM